MISGGGGGGVVVLQKNCLHSQYTEVLTLIF